MNEASSKILYPPEFALRYPELSYKEALDNIANELVRLKPSKIFIVNGVCFSIAIILITLYTLLKLLPDSFQDFIAVPSFLSLVKCVILTPSTLLLPVASVGMPYLYILAIQDFYFYKLPPEKHYTLLQGGQTTQGKIVKLRKFEVSGFIEITYQYISQRNELKVGHYKTKIGLDVNKNDDLKVVYNKYVSILL